MDSCRVNEVQVKGQSHQHSHHPAIDVSLSEALQELGFRDLVSLGFRVLRASLVCFRTICTQTPLPESMPGLKLVSQALCELLLVLLA